MSKMRGLRAQLFFYPKKLKIPNRGSHFELNHCSYFSAANPALLPYIWAELAVLFAGKSQTALMKDIFWFPFFFNFGTKNSENL